MDLATLQNNWDELGKTDPLWAILSDPAKKDGKWNLDEFLRTGEQEIADLFDLLQSLGLSVGSARALDFGCGIGRLTRVLSTRFDECWGVDIAPSMIAFANQLNPAPDRCHYHLNAKNDLSFFPSEHFDFIYTRFVLQHMDPRYSKRYITEFLRVLAPDGVLVFQIPYSRSEQPADNSVQRTTSTTALPPEAFNANLAASIPPTSVKAGSVVRISVTVRNDSKIVWPALGAADGTYFVRLGNHWRDANGNLLMNDDVRANLPQNLGPGSRVDLTLQVTAPAAPGDYILELDMVQEAVAWFAQHGSKTTGIPFSVEGGEQQRAGDGKPGIIEMYAVPKDEVSRIIYNSGGHIVHVIEDGSAGPEWRSFTYYVRKGHSSMLDRIKRVLKKMGAA